MTTTRLSFRRRTLILSALALAAALFLWNTPALAPLVYPFRLFVTFVHETGHGLAALLTGGRFLGFQVFENGTGIALTAGGSRLLILPAGYLGTAAFGAILFYLAHTVPHSRRISAVLGVLVGIVTLLYTGLLSASFSPVAFIVGLLTAGALIWLGRRADDDINRLALNLLAIMTGLHAVFDLIGLIGSSGAMLGNVRSDAAAFSAEVFPLIPGAVWALIWAALALAMLGAAVYFSIVRPWLRKRG